MPTVQKLPDRDTLLRLHEQGLTNKEIGERYGTTTEAVRLAYAKIGMRRTPPRPSHSRFVPWKLRADHVGDMLARRLRLLSKQAQGIELSESEQRLLNEWLQYMDGANPWRIPLSVHYSRTDNDGFWLEPRKDGDRDYISPPAE